MALQPMTITKVTKVQSMLNGETTVYIQHTKKKSIPARLALMGDRRGVQLLPEIGDEVIVGFVNETPLEAVILGILPNTNKSIPQPEDNDKKSIVSPSGMRVHFNDAKKTISIDTPAGNLIVLSENDKSVSIEDQNGNSIKMESGGISLKSPKDINIEAAGEINIKANQNLKLEGLDIDCKSKAQLNLEGGAGAKLTTPAVVEVKGSLVKIN